MIDPKQDDLSAFADWYLREGPRHIKPPAQDTMMHVEGLTGLCVYRNPPFQVELFLVRPNVFIPQHIIILWVLLKAVAVTWSILQWLKK